MAETLGMLCDKLTVVKLKEYHTEDAERLQSLQGQAILLQQEIDQYVADAVAGRFESQHLTFASNKVFKQGSVHVPEVVGKIGDVFSQLAEVNCQLWHEQEKVYEFEKVPADQKDIVVKQLAVLNLQRNKCIDSINQQFAEMILHTHAKR